MRQAKVAVTLLLLSLTMGCKTYTVAPGADPFVVHAEYTAEVSLEIFDSFLAWERKNEAALLKVDPGIHRFADTIRDNGKRWIEELTLETRAYKANRTGTNRDRLLVAQAFVDLAIREVQFWTVKGKAK